MELIKEFTYKNHNVTICSDTIGFGSRVIYVGEWGIPGESGYGFTRHCKSVKIAQQSAKRKIDRRSKGQNNDHS